jgi:hypothetical protein
MALLATIDQAPLSTKIVFFYDIACQYVVNVEQVSIIAMNVHVKNQYILAHSRTGVIS